jgi:hypothetical protein
MQKALVHSSPSSASILPPAASTLDRSRAVQPKPRKPGQVLRPPGPPCCANRLVENGSHVNSGFLHLGCREPAEQLDRRGITLELGWRCWGWN